MKIAIDRERLFSALTVVKDCVSNDGSVALKSILIETKDDDKIVLTSTNLTQVISTEASARVVAPGRIAVPARFFQAAVCVLTSPIVEFDSDDSGIDKAVLRGGDVTYKFSTLKADEFPKAVQVEGKAITLGGDAVRRMFSRVAYSAATDMTRRSLCGVLLDGSNGVIKSVATDGSRMSVAKTTCEGKFVFKVIIPNATVKMINKIVSPKDKVCIKVGKDAIVLKSDGWSLQTKLIDEAYPDYFKPVDSAKTDKEAVVSRDELISSIEQASVSSDTTTPRVTMLFADGTLSLTASDAAISDSRSTIPVRYGGEKVALDVNPYYIIDIMSSLGADEVKLLFKDGGSPIVVESETDDFIGIVMPLRIN